MTNFVEMMTEEDALTANGALTNSTSHDFCLDLFFLAGACRNTKQPEIEKMLMNAYSIDPLKTKKIIFWGGDIRQGAGERRFFKIALEWLSKNHPDDIQNNLDNISEFSRWDVIFDLAMDNEILFSYILKNLVDRESKGHGLLCKWLPRKSKITDKSIKVENNTTTITKKQRTLHKGIAKKIQQRLKWSEKFYRQWLVNGTKVVESQMCKKEWDKINYSQVPSVALHKYNKAWYRNDEERFEQYLKDVKSGKQKINASAIFPHDIIGNSIQEDKVGKLNEAQMIQWDNLPNYMTGVNKILPIIDTSASMTWENNALALKIAVALGLYISERNEGVFKNALISFSSTPKFFYLTGDLNQRFKQLCEQSTYSSTNLQSVFNLILNKATTNKLPQEEMPETILIISDMEFNSGTCGTTNHKQIEQKYNAAGYRIPRIIYWNVNGRPGNVPVTRNDYGAGLLSGASPSILKAVLSNKLNPVDMMNEVIESERYNVIK